MVLALHTTLSAFRPSLNLHMSSANPEWFRTVMMFYHVLVVPWVGIGTDMAGIRPVAANTCFPAD